MKVNELTKYTDQEIMNEFLARLNISGDSITDVEYVTKLLMEDNNNVWRNIDAIEDDAMESIMDICRDGIDSQATVTMPLYEYHALRNEHDIRMARLAVMRKNITDVLKHIKSYTYVMYYYIKDLQTELMMYHSHVGTLNEAISKIENRPSKRTKTFFKRLFNKWED